MYDARKLLVVVLLALAFPAAAPSQVPPSGDAAPPDSTNLEDARNDARVAAFNALSEAHRSQVRAIVERFDAGSVSFSDAAKEIDALLSPDENKAVLAQEQQFRSKVRQSSAVQEAGGPPPEGPPGSPPLGGFPGGGPPAGSLPGGAFPDGDPGSGVRSDLSRPDAGRFLLRIAASPQTLERGEGPP